uniref:Uncharacterized protein n=1 Tax=Anguilla anguilla TaxID=7936 RepID=A0A0E9XV33_ANGAN
MHMVSFKFSTVSQHCIGSPGKGRQVVTSLSPAPRLKVQSRILRVAQKNVWKNSF